MEQKRTPKRASVNGVRNRLNVKNQDPNYVYRIVNDIDDRVPELMDVGYEIDTSTKVGDKRAGAPSSAPGTPVMVSLGQGDKGVVMRIKRELFEERKLEKEQLIREREAALQNPTQNGADYGKVSLKRDN
jgi:hypothetical protein